MKTEEILALENGNSSSIHLVRDRLFFQAWEHSAFLFVHLFRPYKVHHRFVQKVNQDLVWLGFPKSNLEIFKTESEANQWLWNPVSDDHIVVGNLPQIEGFISWKETQVRQEKNSAGTAAPSSENRDGRILVGYRLAYDLTLYLYRTCAKVNRNFKYGLGERLVAASMDLLECYHLALNHARTFDSIRGLVFLQQIRIELRLLHDLKQLSTKQWLFANQQLENLLSKSWPEFLREPAALAEEKSYASMD